jgi:hypothetical protein
MPYTKTIWTNREVERPRTYTLQNNADGTVTLVPAEGTVISAGTPITAENLNNLETQYTQALADVGLSYIPKTDRGVLWGYNTMITLGAGWQGLNAKLWNYHIDAHLYEWTDNLRVKVKKRGLYLARISMSRSDLVANHEWKLGTVKNDNSSLEFITRMRLGDVGWHTSPVNTAAVPLSHWHIYTMEANDYLMFSMVNPDGPRNFVDVRYSIERLGDY